MVVMRFARNTHKGLAGSDLVAISCLAIMGIAAWRVLFRPVIAGDVSLTPEQMKKRDVSGIKKAMRLYVTGSRSNAVCEFDSKSPPAWWLQSPECVWLRSDLQYYVPRRFVGKPIDKVIDQPDFVTVVPRAEAHLSVQED